MTREDRLNYERRILAAEVETVHIAKRAKRFAQLIQRNTQTLDAALIVANFDAERRGYDRMIVEPWMPALLSLLDDLSEILPDEDDNQASVGRNPEGHDRATGHGRNDEHAVPSETSADAPTSPSEPPNKGVSE